MDSDKIIESLVEVMEAAIRSGDWKVDGACDPDMVLYRARKYLEEKGYSEKEEFAEML